MNPKLDRLAVERDKRELEAAQTALVEAKNKADERLNGTNRYTNDGYVQAQTHQFLAKRAARSAYFTADYKTAVLKTKEAIAAYEKVKP